MPATGLLNEAMDDLKATLTAVTGLRVVSDPTKIVPNCVFLDAPVLRQSLVVATLCA
jgi:hypothetical protein